MATLLELTNDLINASLAGNVYTNTSTYLDTVGPNGRLSSQETPINIGDNRYTDSVPYSFLGKNVPAPLRYADIGVAVNWLRNIGRNATGVGIPAGPAASAGENIERATKGAFFVASQFLLASLNPGGLSIPAIGLRGHPSDRSPLNAVWNPLSLLTAGLARVTDPVIAPGTLARFASADYPSSLVTRMKAGIDIMGTTGGQPALRADIPDLPINPLQGAPPSLAATLDAPTSTVDARFPEEGENSTRTDLIPENQIYFPFMFQDLRDTPEQFLYFRAFLREGLTETFVPDWQLESFYGRVDQIPLYKGTIRNVSVAFDIVAWQPNELPVIYRKLEKLQSMVYPEFDAKGFLNKGPIIRMRIGDLFNNGSRKGVPGYITSLDLSYDDGIWNMKTDFKVPRKIAVSLGYTVLHDGNPGIYPFFPSREFDVNDDVPSAAPKEKAFGSAKYSFPSKTSVKIDVSRAEVRKIFQSARGK